MSLPSVNNRDKWAFDELINHVRPHAYCQFQLQILFGQTLYQLFKTGLFLCCCSSKGSKLSSPTWTSLTLPWLRVKLKEGLKDALEQFLVTLCVNFQYLVARPTLLSFFCIHLALRTCLRLSWLMWVHLRELFVLLSLCILGITNVWNCWLMTFCRVARIDSISAVCVLVGAIDRCIERFKQKHLIDGNSSRIYVLFMPFLQGNQTDPFFTVWGPFGHLFKIVVQVLQKSLCRRGLIVI